MTPGGWLTLFISVGTVVSLFGYCLVRVLSEPSTAEGTQGGDGDPKDAD